MDIQTKEKAGQEEEEEQRLHSSIRENFLGVLRKIYATEPIQNGEFTVITLRDIRKNPACEKSIFLKYSTGADLQYIHQSMVSNYINRLPQEGYIMHRIEGGGNLFFYRSVLLAYGTSPIGTPPDAKVRELLQPYCAKHNLNLMVCMGWELPLDEAMHSKRGCSHCPPFSIADLGNYPNVQSHWVEDCPDVENYLLSYLRNTTPKP